MKGQVVTDFIAEFTNVEGQGAKKHPQKSIYTNKSSNRQAGRVGIVFHFLDGDEIECMVRLDFRTTNNEEDFEALVAGLDLAKAVGATNVVVHCDSQVVISQVNGNYECKGEKMKKYLEQVRKWVDDLQAKFVQILRVENEQADHLTKAASTEHMLIPSEVLSFVQLSPLIYGVDVQEIGFESN